jgi:hypothetical protein
MGVRVWTDDRLAELRGLVEVKRYSASMAAEALGVTRNMVIGACDRNGIKLIGRNWRAGDHITLQLLDHPKIADRVAALLDEARAAA